MLLNVETENVSQGLFELDQTVPRVTLLLHYKSMLRYLAGLGESRITLWDSKIKPFHSLGNTVSNCDVFVKICWNYTGATVPRVTLLLRYAYMHVEKINQGLGVTLDSRNETPNGLWFILSIAWETQFWLHCKDSHTMIPPALIIAGLSGRLVHKTPQPVSGCFRS